MGSPSSRLDTDEKFRPWVDAGLEYIFAPGHSQQSAHAGQPVQNMQQQVPVQQPVQQQVIQQQPVQQQQTAQQVQPQVNQVPQQAPQMQRQSVSQTVPPHLRQATTPVAPAAPVTPLHNVKFPEPWNGFLAKVKAQAPKVICTYMELGLDLGGQPDPKRGAVLRNTLTNHLKWPPGTAAFWPMAALVNGALQPNKDMFWKGWQIWKTPYIVCFGDEALNIIHPQAQAGGTTYLYEEITILVAPPLSKLVGMLPHEQQLSTEMLSAVRF